MVHACRPVANSKSRILHVYLGGLLFLYTISITPFEIAKWYILLFQLQWNYKISHLFKIMAHFKKVYFFLSGIIKRATSEINSTRNTQGFARQRLWKGFTFNKGTIYIVKSLKNNTFRNTTYARISGFPKSWFRNLYIIE